ncbi:ScyD/ScyE family protein [Arthrobacter sp.]|uniref:ScyD/ScyE family protein n=1 Tax=Arthrobacter sp. TaxID=1667 RepID=UPI00289A3B1B|nr:ScyD/ScyE family protein [Arthrobacter sp.]
MRKRASSVLPLAAAAALLAGLIGAPPAAAGGRHHHPHPNPLPVAGEVTTLATGLVSPLRIALGSYRSVDVAQSFAGSVVRIGRDGNLTTLDPGIPGYLSDAVSRVGGTTYYALTTGAGEGVPENNVALLRSVDRRGTIRTIADLAVHERTANPDQVNTYGFRDLDAACLAQLDPAIPNNYTGLMDSHPYDTMRIRSGILVADAGANAILQVNERSGRTSTVAVLPPVPVTVTPETAAESGLPACTAGHDYYAEPVPTDMAMGRDGQLYVGSLPGGPTGGPGSIYRVSLRTGAVDLVASGLVSPTGIAVNSRGDIFVAELFANRISVIPRGSATAEPFYEVTAPADVELRGSALYASIDALPPGGEPEPGAPVDPNAPPPVFDGKVIRIQLTAGGDPHGLAQPDGQPAEPNDD